MEARAEMNYRANFYKLITETELEVRRGSLSIACNTCSRALEILAKLNDATPADHRTAAETCHEVGNKHFNEKNYNRAADFYNLGIQCLNNINELYIKLSDTDYRKFAELFIGLSDAYMHQYNQNAAMNAFIYATNAFKLIKNKTLDEKKAFAANDNYASFRELYEKDLSTPNYLQSSVFHNHGIILQQQQEEKNVVEMLNDMFVSDKAKADNDLGQMMEGLTFTAQPFFSEVSKKNEPSDDEYRVMGNQFINLARQQYARQSLHDAVETLKQAYSAFQRISYKTDTDYNKLKVIEENISQLEKQIAEQLRQRSLTNMPGIRLFSQPAQTPPIPDVQMQESDNSMQWENTSSS